jgi:hypothetical protein
MNCLFDSRNKKDGESGYFPPKEGEQAFWVQCKGYRCRAILGKDRKWKCFISGRVLTDIVKVYPD